MYKFGEKLGKGSFGVVWHVTHIGTGEHYACKSINKEKVSKKQVSKFIKTDLQLYSWIDQCCTINQCICHS